MKTSPWIAKLPAAAAVAAALICPLTSSAQEDVLVPGGPIALRVEPLKVEGAGNLEVALAVAGDEKGDVKEEESQGSDYWLGVQVAAVPELVKRQMALKHGLAVEDVTADSPAAKAEIKRYDILLKAGDTPLNVVADLVKTVEAAKGKEIEITVKRDGESRTIRIAADKRPKPEAAVEIVRRKLEAARPELAGEIKQLEEALEKLKSKAGKDGFGIVFAKPAIVAPRFDLKFDNQYLKETRADFPKDLSVQINKAGNEPAKIHVKRGDKEWNVTDKTIGELPEEIRGHVQKMLHGQVLSAHSGGAGIHTVRVLPGGKVDGVLNISPVAPAAPVAPAPPAPPAAPGAPASPAKPAIAARTITARVERTEDGTSAKLDAIMKKLEKLESEVESLREKK